MDQRSIISEYFNELWNLKNTKLDELNGIFSPNVLINSPLGRKIGADSMQDTIYNWLSAFPNMQVSNIDLTMTESLVIADWDSSARHEGAFQSIQPTGKTIVYHGVTVFCFDENKKIIRYFCQLDLSHIYKQLGYFLMQEQYCQQEILHSNKK